MEDSEIKTFRRNDNPSCTLTSLYFSVLKHENFGPMVDRSNPSSFNGTYFTFYAIIGELKVNQTYPVPVANPVTKGQTYEGQIGSIQCMHGWIEELLIAPSDESPEENPLRCGIGTVLTELCLIDPDIGARREGNRAERYLRGFHELPMIQRHCDRLVGLVMAAEPIGGGHTYFTAAINMRYFVVIVEHCEDDQHPIDIYPTQEAKEKYNTTTGNIDEYCDRGINPRGCRAYGSTWYFCH